MAQSGHPFHEVFDTGIGKAWGAISTGLVVSLLLIIMSISYPSLIFAGKLEQYSGIGIQMALFSAMAICILLSFLSTSPGVVGIAQGETAAVIGLATASIAETLTASGHDHQVLPTVLVTIVISGLLVGILFTLLGGLRLGNLIRFVPLPVTGGFLAGVGWLLSNGAVKSMTGLPLVLNNVPILIRWDMALRWLPGLVSALLLLILQRYRRNVFNLFAVVTATVALFWLAAWLFDVSPATLGADGWLMAGVGGEGGWTPFEYIGAIADTNWVAVLSQAPQLGSLLVIASISLLMAASSIELLSKRDMDLNRELLAAGLGNFVCATMGSLPGYHSLGASALAQKMGTPVRMVGLVSALVCAVVYGLGVSFLSVLPKILVGTIILYVALTLLFEWLYETWFKLSVADYSILLLVFGCVSFVGLITGVAVGLIAGVAKFAFENGRIGIARQVGSSVDIRSNVVYSEAVGAILREYGRESYIVKLQGFIFFGTANGLLDRIQSRMRDSEDAPLRSVALDFRHVYGIDSSAAFSFLKLRQYAENSRFTVALAGLAPKIDRSLRVAGAYDGAPASIRKFDDLDYALEYCEKTIISAHLSGPIKDVYPIGEQLRRAFSNDRQAAAFKKYLNPVTLSKGDFLIRQGAGSDDLFFIERGRVAVFLEKTGATQLRVNAMGPGTVVGEIAFFLGPPRSATVVVEADITAYRLTRESLETIRTHDPDLVILFNEFMVRMLAERLVDSNRLIRTDQTGPVSEYPTPGGNRRR